MAKKLKQLDDALSAGRKAFKLDVPKNNNPYTNEGEAWAWANGWQTEQKLAPKKTKRPERDQFYHE
jgi:hypothetical protein